MIAVTVKNTSFDEAVVKQVLAYNCNKTFRYVAELESSSFYGYKVPKYSSCTRYKHLLGFPAGALKNATKIREFSMKFQLICVLSR